MQRIEIDFKKVQTSLDNIKSLQAWQSLKESENTQLSSELIIPDTTEQDIYNEVLFIDYAIDHIEAKLKQSAEGRPDDLQYYRDKLTDLKTQFSKLGLANTCYPENYCCL